MLEGWGRRWGIYLTSRRPFDEVRTQLRRVLMVRNDQSGAADVLPVLRSEDAPPGAADVGGAAERAALGEIEAFLVEGKDGELVRLAAHDAPAALTARVEPPGAASGLELDA